MLPVLVRPKLNRPRLSRDIVHRPALVQRLNSGLDRPLTLVIAPAGFGKTTLLAEWASQSPHRVTWLTLDEGDNDLATFVSYFITALQQLFPRACPDTQALLHAPQLPKPETIASILTNEIDDLPDRFVLVLDDYHFISRPALHQLTDTLLNHPPLQMHILLASRSDPPLALPRLRARGAMSELRATDLRFSRQEAKVFLAQAVGSEMSEQLVTPLWERVEGWIAGLQLASLSVHSPADSLKLIQQLTRGRNRFIMDYLFEQVFQRQTPSLQQFLLKTSILDRVSPALAQAVVAENILPSARVELVDLERAGLFLTALDETDEWFQYHALFRESLHHTLEHTHTPDEIAELHGRACQWFRQNGLVEEALRHALAANQKEMAVQIVVEHFSDRLNRFDRFAIERWLVLLPAQVVDTHPWLLVAKAFVLHYRSHWDAMLPVMKRAEHLVNVPNGATDLTERALLRGYLDALWSDYWMATGEAALAKETAHTAIHNLPATHTGAHELVLIPLVSALHSLGDFATAERLLYDMLAHEPLMPGSEVTALPVLFARVFIYVAEGYTARLDQAANLLLQKATEANVPLMQAWAHMALGEAAYELNDLPRATEHFATGAALRYAAHTRAGHECLVGLALAQQASGHPDEARSTVALLLDYLGEWINPALSAEGDSLQARLALFNGEAEIARRWSASALPELAPWWCWLLEIPAITRLRVQVADRDVNNLETTRLELDSLLELVTRLHKPRRMAELLTLKALLLDRLNERDEALKALGVSLAVGEPRGLVRSIVDAGPQLEPLIKAIARRSPSSYLDRVLAALHLPVAPGVSSQRVAPDLGHPKISLTHREQDVLALLGRRYTDREIAGALVISPVTVRTHIEHLSQKLGVHGRRAVVARARELGLLTQG